MNEMIEIIASVVLIALLLFASAVVFLSVFYDVTKLKVNKNKLKTKGIYNITSLLTKFNEISLMMLNKGYAFILNRNVKRVNLKTGKYIPVIVSVAIMIILVQTYSILMAATLQTNSLLLIGWLAIIIWVAIGTWYHSNESFITKIIITMSTPFLYFLVYVRLVSFVFLWPFSAVRKVH